LGSAEGIATAHAVLVALSCGLTMVATRYRTNHDIWAVLGGGSTLILSLTMYAVAGTHLFGAVLLPVVLLGCDQLVRSKVPLFVLPCLFLVWTNCDPSAVLGLVVVACFFLAAAVSGWTKSTTHPPRFVRYAVLFVACLAATCAHPDGIYALAALVAQATAPGAGELALWQPLVLWSLSGWTFLFSLVTTALLLRHGPRPWLLLEVLLLAFFGVLTLTYASMLLWWAIVWPWVVTPHAMAWVEDRQRRPGTDAPPDANEIPLEPTTMQTLIAMACVFMAILLSPPAEALLTGQPLGEGRISRRDTPMFVADELERRRAAGAVFAPRGWSDYLIWHSEGTLCPLVYNRVIPTTPTWEDYEQLAAGNTGWEAIAEHYGLKYFVLSRAANPELIRRAIASPVMEVLYQDRLGVILKRLDDQPGEPTNEETTGESPPLKRDLK